MRAVKYLGVTLDSKLSFTRHIRAVSASAAVSARAIGRLMPNVSGPSVAKRRLLAAVVSSKLLYAAPVWATRAVALKCNVEAEAGGASYNEVLPDSLHGSGTVSGGDAPCRPSGTGEGDCEEEAEDGERGWCGRFNRGLAVTAEAWQRRWTEETSVGGGGPGDFFRLCINGLGDLLVPPSRIEWRRRLRGMGPTVSTCTGLALPPHRVVLTVVPLRTMRSTRSLTARNGRMQRPS